MKNKYFIKWKEPIYDDLTSKRFAWKNKQKILTFNNDSELNDFIQNKQKIKIEFICELRDNAVPPLDNLTISEYEDLLYLVEEAIITPGLTSKKHYGELRDKLVKLQNGVENAKEQPKYNWIFAGEDTEGSVEWCENTGALKDSGGEIQYPKNYK